MPVLSDQELAQLAYNAGFRGDALRWAVAIAKAESGGNPSAYNPEISAGTVPGSGSRGLWQIYGTAHPQYNSSLAFDPSVNARAAFEVYSQAGRRFTPWSTFNNGMAASYYNTIRIPNSIKAGSATTTSTRSQQPANRGGVAGSGDPGLAQQLQQNTQAINDIASGKFLSNIFGKVDTVSLGFYVAGAILILIGLFVIFQKPALTIAGEGAKLALATAL